MVTLIIIAALLAGAAVLVSLQLASSRSTDLTRSSVTALYCSEAGLSAARRVVADNYAAWNASLASPGIEPPFLRAAFSHDLDGDGIDDFLVTLRDNDDEYPPLTNDVTRDNDLQVFVVSRCTKFPDTPQEVSELIHVTGPSKCYQSQEGGCGGNGNSN